MLRKGIDELQGIIWDIETKKVKIVDWNDVSNSDFLYIQLWITRKCIQEELI